MKKIIKMFGILFSIALIISIFSNIYAFGDGFDKSIYNKISNDNVSNSISNTAEKVTGTIMTILQVLAVCGVMILGVKYMFAGASDKANIKQTLIYAIIGLIFVFGAASVVKMFIDIGNEVVTVSKNVQI